MKLVLDTNVYTQCDSGVSEALDALERADHLYLPVIAYGELYYGFKYGDRLGRNLSRLDKFIETFQVEIINVDSDVAWKFGDIFASLRKKGKPIPTNDIWISACCMAVGGILITADRHFQQVDQIQVQLISPMI